MKEDVAEKAKIRRWMLRQRQALSPYEVKRMGKAIYVRLTGTDFYRQARCLSCFVSVAKETDTRSLIRDALNAGKRVAVPVVGRRPAMKLVEIHALSDLHPAPFGLLEPSGPGRVVIPPGACDLVIVPGLAFDRQGNRIGFGAGYYDWLLARVRAPKIALAYEFQIFDRLPTGPRDIRMDYLVTETGVYACGSAS